MAIRVGFACPNCVCLLFFVFSALKRKNDILERQHRDHGAGFEKKLWHLMTQRGVLRGQHKTDMGFIEKTRRRNASFLSMSCMCTYVPFEGIARCIG